MNVPKKPITPKQLPTTVFVSRSGEGEEDECLIVHEAINDVGMQKRVGTYQLVEETTYIGKEAGAHVIRSRGN